MHRDNMKTLLIAALLAITAPQVSAQAIKASELDQLCSSKSESDNAACLLIVQAYMHGFIEGVGKGVMDTYKYDPQLLALVRDVPMKDMAPRVNKVAQASTCIQRVSVGQMKSTFVEFVRANPMMKEKSYREALTRAIVSKYCNK